MAWEHVLFKMRAQVYVIVMYAYVRQFAYSGVKIRCDVQKLLKYFNGTDIF